MQSIQNDKNVIAVLGPTNTGKTYLAMERLLAHGSGMIGFPLRLLARENYERAVQLKGPRQVALITGEEKIIPNYAKYYFCTVEAMPVSKKVDFLAIDEIQMCSDPDRGHIFTYRLLHARGQQETMFMGSESIRPFLARLVPGIIFQSRPRFSKLTYAGSRKVNRLPPRSAVVAFSASDVYAFAELIRRQRGGAAIVMGALSPRTRNAQVKMFQSGDVDYLVATDAIGMGLNMDLDHIAFASLKKFDGNYRRNLQLNELVQIAGRAGRHMSNGTFGVTGEAKEFNPHLIQQIEKHHYNTIKNLQWRNPKLDFYSFDSLIESLGVKPRISGLVKVRQPNDEKFLIELASDEKVQRRLTDSYAIKLLWQVCQVPDFRKQNHGGHVVLLSHIFQSLMDHGSLNSNWIKREINRVDNVNGDIELLVDRIANIRIWTYISNRSKWVEEAQAWAVRTREIENRLSDALHERLTQRFVDQRTSVLVKRLKEQKVLESAISVNGDVLVESHFVGRIEGFNFIPDNTDSSLAGRTVSAAAHKALIKEAQRRVVDVIEASDSDFSIDAQGRIFWSRSGKKQFIAYLTAGLNFLRPRVKLTSNVFLDGRMKNTVESRICTWLYVYIDHYLIPLTQARDGQLTGPLRGLVYQLVENGGAVNKRKAINQLHALSKKDYCSIRRLGIKIGREDIFLPKLLRPKSAGLNAMLWAIKNKINPVPELPASGCVSLLYHKALSLEFMKFAGYRRAGNLLVRIDILERLFGMLKMRADKGPFELDAKILNFLGCNQEQAVSVLRSIGYNQRKTSVIGKSTSKKCVFESKSQNIGFIKKNRSKASKSRKNISTKIQTTAKESPFAKLKEISTGLKTT